MKHDHSAFSYPDRAQARVAYGSTPAELIRKFMPMVKRLAWHAYGSGRPGMEVEDLVQSGLMALTECIQRHQGQGDHAFAAYAKTRVRGAMFDLIRREAPTTRTAARKRREIESETQRLAAVLGRTPGEAEVAEAMGMDKQTLSAMRSSSQPMRFDPIDLCYSDSNTAFADDAPDADDELVAAEQSNRLSAAIGSLSERLQLVIQLYFVEELNLSEIAQVLEVSIPRVHQLKAQALGQLNAAMQLDDG